MGKKEAESVTPDEHESLMKRIDRRRMSWSALLSLMVVTALSMFVVSEHRIELASNIIETFQFCMSSIVLGYLGISTYDEINRRKHSNITNIKLPTKKNNIDNPDA